MNELILNGFIDIHTHLKYGEEGKEDFLTGTLAALNGGVCTLADMPNDPKAVIDKRSYFEKLNTINILNLPANLFLYSLITKKSIPFSYCKHYKIFMNEFNDEELEKALHCKKYKDSIISFHCEDHEIIEKYKTKKAQWQQRPKEAEITAIEKAISLIKKYGIKGNICHVSTAEGLRLIKEAKNTIDITCEATLHHLFFDLGNVKRFKNAEFIFTNPPLREKEDRLALLEALRNNDIDFLVTDHAPHTIDEKIYALESGLFNYPGVPNLDCYGPFVTWLIKEQGVSIKTIENITHYNPSKFLGANEKDIESFVILNLSKPFFVEKHKLRTKCNWSPFEGFTFPGSVKLVCTKNRFYVNLAQ